MFLSNLNPGMPEVLWILTISFLGNCDEEQRRLKANPRYIASIEQVFLTLDLCLSSVHKDGFLLKYCPPVFMTRELYALAVEKTVYVLKHVNIPEFQTYTMWEKAVKRYGFLLKYCPPVFMCQELYDLAVEKSGKNVLNYLPMNTT